MKKSILLFTLGLLATTGAHAAFIAQWTFETSIPTTGGPLAPEVGVGVATASVGTFSSPAGWGSLKSWSSTTWDVNDYYQFQVDTTGLGALNVTWDQTGSSTGPANFKLSYSTDGISFTDFGTYNVTLDSWNTTATPVASVKSFDLSSITALNDQPTVYFRLVDISTTSIGGATVAGTGTGRIDNFTVDAVAIPEPSTYALIGLGLSGLFVLRRMKKSIKA